MKRNKLGQFIKGSRYPKEWAIKRIRPKGLKYKIKAKNNAWFKQNNRPWNKETKGICIANSGSIKKGEHHSRKTEFKSEDVLGNSNNNWKGNDVGIEYLT